jgi:phosphopantetheinyl transferase
MPMKMEKPFLHRFTEPCVPDAIYVCFEQFETDIKKVDVDVLQNQSGRLLIKKMSDHFFSAEDIKIFTEKNEKPEMYCDGREISVSFSHTNDGVAAAMSKQFIVGCDMEHADREVHPRLVERMKHPDELPDLYEKTDAIRIWTLKESALKMIGTGLRKPMKGVHISSLQENQFQVRFDDGNEAKICSFRHNYHWISICYQTF